jgi:hypothetical protein
MEKIYLNNLFFNNINDISGLVIINQDLLNLYFDFFYYYI